jgi:hypothetical protein
VLVVNVLGDIVVPVVTGRGGATPDAVIVGVIPVDNIKVLLSAKASELIVT